ncbi:retinoic acid-induced protein 1 [Syngnathus scovelli]|uniref:retinoic acid-induced protein 1 n=1 Tax=Syngnathus scovelli TaxID=161590 RepID=UPI0021103CCF|nr:retinoic acid-induced protein 1 [Syngnathus scovelli]XP_049615659.1 retinoic acid-induced protein 1 [Syngnathus scovelli]
MEQPPWSFDDLQPQDLSTSSIPNVVDLTRNGSLNVKPCDVHSADWHPNSGLPSTQTTISSNSSQQSADQIQPDNALSHTTVTLSYVSSSPINSASQPLTGLPPICKFSLLPSCEAEKGLRETTYTLSQHYLEHCDTPVDLVTKAPEVDRLCLPQEICELNGTVSSSTTRREEHGIPESAETSDSLENGRDDSWSSLGVVSLETDMTVLRTGNSETLLQVSKKEEPVQNKEAAIELRLLTRDCKSPLEEPVCPSATSPCDLDHVLMLPQASASPSGDNSFPADEAAWDDSITEGATFHSTDENRQPVHPRRPEPKPLTEDVCPLGISEDKPNTLTTPHMNGNVQERKLPLRSNRGVRLQSLVMNINSSSYKVSARVNTNANASKTRDSYAINPKKNDTLSNGKSRSKAKAKHKVVTPPKKANANGIKMHQCKNTTSNCVVHSKKSNSKFTKAVPEEVLYPGHLPQVRSKRKNSKKEPHLVHSDPPSLEKKQARCSPPAAKESPKKSPCSPKDPPKSSAAKKKVARTPKKRRKKRQPAPFFSIFAPREPEIKLRYVHYKEEKKDSRYRHFSPFIRMQSSTSQCTVVNDPEEVATQAKKGPREQEDHHSSFISGTVPNSSCLQLGRASTQGQRRGALVCCLCGLSANAMDLGDLHGPYYPEGQRVSRPKTSTLGSDLKDRKNDYSDSDSSSCSVGGRGKKRAANQWWQKGLPPTIAADDTGSPAAVAKRARSEMWPADVEDWYSAPVLPMEPREYWLHEDCAIWSAGVFLVKGRVYGLEETVKVARQTMCSACSGPGATLGCFFKGCPSKYHYRCALEADCILIEENFSMKCKKHKNKTLKAPVGMHSDPRRKRPP